MRQWQRRQTTKYRNYLVHNVGKTIDDSSNFSILIIIIIIIMHHHDHVHDG